MSSTSSSEMMLDSSSEQTSSVTFPSLDSMTEVRRQKRRPRRLQQHLSSSLGALWKTPPRRSPESLVSSYRPLNDEVDEIMKEDEVKMKKSILAPLQQRNSSNSDITDSQEPEQTIHFYATPEKERQQQEEEAPNTQDPEHIKLPSAAWVDRKRSPVSVMGFLNQPSSFSRRASEALAEEQQRGKDGSEDQAAPPSFEIPSSISSIVGEGLVGSGDNVEEETLLRVWEEEMWNHQPAADDTFLFTTGDGPEEVGISSMTIADDAFLPRLLNEAEEESLFSTTSLNSTAKENPPAPSPATAISTFTSPPTTSSTAEAIAEPVISKHHHQPPTVFSDTIAESPPSDAGTVTTKSSSSYESFGFGQDHTEVEELESGLAIAAPKPEHHHNVAAAVRHRLAIPRPQEELHRAERQEQRHRRQHRRQRRNRRRNKHEDGRYGGAGAAGLVCSVKELNEVQQDFLWTWSDLRSEVREQGVCTLFLDWLYDDDYEDEDNDDNVRRHRRRK